MKYTEKNPPLVCLMTHSTCYQQSTTMPTIKGILWHSTGANNPNLKRYVQPYEGESNYQQMMDLLGKNIYKNDWNHMRVQAGVNAWIGKLEDGTVATVQTLPWNHKPWGCGTGPKGSLNNGFLQFEICEDSLSDSNYFNKVYKEACELTAYLCEKFNINPKGTVQFNGITVPTILSHKDSYDLGLGTGHADVQHWFSRYGKTMDDVRNDVASLIKPAAAVPLVPGAELYRIRKTWSDVASQVGAYRDLMRAKEACDKAGNDYYVFNKAGEILYPEVEQTVLKVGDVIRLKDNAKYSNGTSIPKWVIGSTIYLREIRADGSYVISTLKSGAITGVVKPDQVYVEQFQKYEVIINTTALNVRSAPSLSAGKLGVVTMGTKHMILDENSGWGKIKFQGVEAWISLSYTKKV